MRLLPALLMVSLAGPPALVAQSSDPAKLAKYLKSLPDLKPPVYDEVERLAIAANPLGCEDHPYTAADDGGGRGLPYLWQGNEKPQILEEYDKKRAFYGCHDWHSSVNSTWMMVSIYKSDPALSVGPAIRLELDSHIQKANIDGELAFFQGLKGRRANYEKPYGYAWMLRLYGEAKTWNDPEGKRVAATLEPLAKWMAQQYMDYLRSLNYPIRDGLHPNTALDMIFTLNYTANVHDTAMQTVIHDTAIRLFADDEQCATQSEPVFGEFGSPCLLEAALMAQILDPPAYSKWLDAFLPAAYSQKFAVYGNDVDPVNGDNRDLTGTEEEGLPNSHLIGLNFQRATDLLQMANGLPPSDPRIAVYRKLSNICAARGFERIGTAGYIGTHWLSTYALMYENEVAHPATRQ